MGRGSWELTYTGEIVPYVRTTQRQKWVDPRYKRYQRFKDALRLVANTKGFPDSLNTGSAYSLSLTMYWRKKARADLDNLLKGILDSLFTQDRRVTKLDAVSYEQSGEEYLTLALREMVG